MQPLHKGGQLGSREARAPLGSLGWTAALQGRHQDPRPRLTQLFPIPPSGGSSYTSDHEQNCFESCAWSSLQVTDIRDCNEATAGKTGTGRDPDDSGGSDSSSRGNGSG